MSFVNKGPLALPQNEPRAEFNGKLGALDWLAEFTRDPTGIGAVAPSSSGLASLITETASLEQARVVVELGAGTGVFTAAIMERLQSDALFFSIEINDRLVLATRDRCPDATVYQDNASNLGKYLDAYGVSTCDCVISGLPWAAFNPRLQDAILSAVIERLNPRGEFLTFAYLQGLMLPAGRRFRRRLDESFRRVLTTRVVWSNVPPALVYYCSKT